MKRFRVLGLALTALLALCLIFLFILWLSTKKNLSVESQNGVRLTLKEVQFGRIILRESKDVIMGQNSQGGRVVNLGQPERAVNERNIQLKEGVAFGAMWKIPVLSPQDELVIDVAVTLPKEIEIENRKTRSIEFLWKYTHQDQNTMQWLGWQFKNIDPNGPLLTGPWLFRYSNKGELLAERTFHLVKAADSN